MAAAPPSLPLVLGAAAAAEDAPEEGDEEGRLTRRPVLRRLPGGEGADIDWHELLHLVLVPPSPALGESCQPLAGEVAASQRGERGGNDDGKAKALEGRSDTFEVLTSFAALWLYAFLFVGVELWCLCFVGESFFGILTGGTLMSLREPQGFKTLCHVLGGSAMWVLGFVQIIFRRWRKGPLAWIHRFGGKLFLFLWFGIVAPTATYLALNISVGRTKAQIMMTLAAMVTLDTTLFASYYFWRAWVVARRRLRGAESLALHGRAMRVGLLFTMIQLTQRPLQLVLILVRCSLLVAASLMPLSWLTMRWMLEEFVARCLDHHVVLAFTLILPYGILLMVLLDGPWSGIAQFLMELQPCDLEDFYGRSRPSKVELYLWRLRMPLYAVFRAFITHGWREDPLVGAAPEA